MQLFYITQPATNTESRSNFTSGWERRKTDKKENMLETTTVVPTTPKQ